MFVEPAFAASSEYAQFWDKLRRGEYQAAQFKRIGKGGRVVWIEASYNPILDASGRPYKVVKFATDITGQVELLNRLKTLIDRNFGEIGEALGRSDGQSGAAMDAATETSASVQTVAAAAEELASSAAGNRDQHDEIDGDGRAGPAAGRGRRPRDTEAWPMRHAR